MLALTSALPDWAEQTLTTIGVIAGGLTAIGVLLKIPPVRWVLRNVFGRTWRALVGDPLSSWFRGLVHEAVSEEIEAIRKEVTPNGGDTQRLGDRVSRIETGLDEVKAALGLPAAGSTGELPTTK